MVADGEPPSIRDWLSSTDTIITNFRERYFPDVLDEDWDDWAWQFRNRFVDRQQLSKVLILSPNEEVALAALEEKGKLTVNVTPYYLSLISSNNPLQPLRRTIVPTMAELSVWPGESIDPLHEECDSPIPKVVHRYKDRALILTTDSCSSYCRYCTRSRLIGTSAHNGATSMSHFRSAFDYIRSDKGIRDVILSGGDPLLLGDHTLDWVLSELRSIPHVEIIRIGTKVPVVLPQRITPHLCRILRTAHPLFMSIHFIHPDECTSVCSIACERLADAGIPLGSQTVLLAGINDDVPTMKLLMRRLLMMRVRPYYLYQCDPVVGTAHFRTPVSKGLEIIEGLRGHTSGYAIPTFVIDAPGGGGKVPLQPNYIVKQDGPSTDIMLRNFRGGVSIYPDKPSL
jgi:lysine 2,3-aminomutase